MRETTLTPQEAMLRTQLIPRPPREVLGAVLRAVAGGGRFDLAEVQRQLAASPETKVGGQAVSSLVQTEALDCRTRVDLVPTAVWAKLCAKGGVVDRYSFSGDPGVARAGDPRLHALDPAEAVPFWVSGAEARQLAGTLGLTLEDVTRAYQTEWPGHLPFMEYAFAFSRPDSLLLIIKTDTEVQSKVNSITVYTHR